MKKYVNIYNNHEIYAVLWDGENLREVIDLIGFHKSAINWTWEEYELIVKQSGLKIFNDNESFIALIGNYIVVENEIIKQYEPSSFNQTFMKKENKEWNDINEIKPKHKQVCIVTDGKDVRISKWWSDFELGMWTFVGCNEKLGVYAQFMSTKDQPTHWMKLPELPK